MIYYEKIGQMTVALILGGGSLSRFDCNLIIFIHSAIVASVFSNVEPHMSMISPFASIDKYIQT